MGKIQFEIKKMYTFVMLQRIKYYAFLQRLLYPKIWGVAYGCKSRAFRICENSYVLLCSGDHSFSIFPLFLQEKYSMCNSVLRKYIFKMLQSQNANYDNSIKDRIIVRNSYETRENSTIKSISESVIDILNHQYAMINKIMQAEVRTNTLNSLTVRGC